MTKQHILLLLLLLTGWWSVLWIPLASIGPPSWWRREFCGFDHRERPSGMPSKSTSTEMVIGCDWMNRLTWFTCIISVQCTIGFYLSNRPPTASMRTKTLHRNSKPPEPSLYPSRGLRQQNLSLTIIDHWKYGYSATLNVYMQLIEMIQTTQLFNNVGKESW